MTAGDGAAAPGQAAYPEAVVEAAAKAIGTHMILRESPREIARATLAAIAAAAAAQPALPKLLAHPGDLADQWLAETYEPGDYDDTEPLLDAFRAGHDKARELYEAAAAQPAPGDALRTAIGDLADSWHEHAATSPATSTHDEIVEKAAVRECADELAAVLDEHPAAPAAPAAAPDPRLVPLDPAMLHREVHRLSELLGEIGVMAANAPEDGDSFAVCEEIAMRVAAADVKEGP